VLADFRKRYLLRVVVAGVALVGLPPATAYADHEEGHEVTVDGAAGGAMITIQVPGMAGIGNGRYGSDEGVNLNPCWYVEDPTGNVAEGEDLDSWPTEEQYVDPGVIWYGKYCSADAYGSDSTTRGAIWVLVGGPVPPANPPPPPATLAALAVKYMPFPLPAVRMNPATSGVVNLPTWMWLDNASWQLDPGRLSLRGVTVTVIATPKYVEWTTGSGTKRCNGQGRAYNTDAPPESQSTYCSWTYTESSAGEPGEKYKGTATSVWGVHWISTGGPTGPQQGDLPVDIRRTSTFEYEVEEIQSVVTK